MADLPPDTGVGPDREQRPGTPRWVQVLGLIALVVGLLLIVFLLRSGGHGPARHGATAGDGGATAAAGAAGQGVVGAPAAANQAARTLRVTTLDTMAFEPSSIAVAAGETVTFVVTNPGKTAHEITLGDAAMQQEHAGMMSHMPAGMAHDTSNSMRLQPGETKQLTWRFGSTGTLEYACHEPGHYQAGMRGQITIT